MSDPKVVLHLKLREERAALLRSIDGLDEYDRRRPMTPSGTNLLGLIKHLTGIEYGYLGSAFGRPSPTELPWVADGSLWQGGDMWARPDESSDFLLGLYRDANEHADETIRTLDLSSPGFVAHWPEAARHTDLGVLLVRVVAETGHHAGHADIVREMIDGRGGSDHDGLDAAGWERYLAQVTAAADAFR